MSSVLSKLYEEWKGLIAPAVGDWQAFRTIVEEESESRFGRSKSLGANQLKEAYAALVQAFSDAGEPPPDYATMAHFFAQYRPVAVYGMLMRWHVEDMRDSVGVTAFRKGDVYETSYGTARVTQTGEEGRWAMLRIDKPSKSAADMGYKRGDIFQAHLDDQTEPSPRTWAKIG